MSSIELSNNVYLDPHESKFSLFDYYVGFLELIWILEKTFVPSDHCIFVLFVLALLWKGCPSVFDIDGLIQTGRIRLTMSKTWLIEKKDKFKRIPICLLCTQNSMIVCIYLNSIYYIHLILSIISISPRNSKSLLCKLFRCYSVWWQYLIKQSVPYPISKSGVFRIERKWLHGHVQWLLMQRQK